MLEAEANLRLVLTDSTETTGKRLVGYHYLNSRRYLQARLSDEDYRAGPEDHVAWSKEAARAMKEYLSSPAFDEVRDALTDERDWHGFKGVEQLFEAAGIPGEYSTFKLQSAFVHSSNLDLDFEDIGDDGFPILRVPMHLDVDRVEKLVEGMLLRCLRLGRHFLEDRGTYYTYHDPLRGVFEDGEKADVHPIDAIGMDAKAAFGWPDEVDEATT